MAYLCNCRAISSRKLDQYLKDQQGTVRLKDAMGACSNGASCCRAHAESCAMAVQRVVDNHNQSFLPPVPEPTETPDAGHATIVSQSTPGSVGPKEPVC